MRLSACCPCSYSGSEIEGREGSDWSFPPRIFSGVPTPARALPGDVTDAQRPGHERLPDRTVPQRGPFLAGRAGRDQVLPLQQGGRRLPLKRRYVDLIPRSLPVQSK